jgi:hypothetical protein
MIENERVSARGVSVCGVDAGASEVVDVGEDGVGVRVDGEGEVPLTCSELRLGETAFGAGCDPQPATVRSTTSATTTGARRLLTARSEIPGDPGVGSVSQDHLSDERSRSEDCADLRPRQPRVDFSAVAAVPHDAAFEELVE